MRIILLSMLCGMFLAANAQTTEVGNMRIINGEVVFQRVYDCPPSFNASQLLKNGPFVETSGDMLSATLDNYAINFKKHGKSYMNYPMYMHGTLRAKIVIDIKDGKYRVTASHLMANSNIDFDYGSVTEKSSYVNIETYAVNNKGEFKQGQVKAIQLINDDFGLLFLANTTTTTDNW